METTEASPFERAIGLEIRLEATRIGLSHRRIQEMAGIQDRSFRRYFVKGERHIPFDDLVKVADALGVDLAELIERARTHIDAAEPVVRAVTVQRVDADAPTSSTPDQP